MVSDAFIPSTVLSQQAGGAIVLQQGIYIAVYIIIIKCGIIIIVYIAGFAEQGKGYAVAQVAALLYNIGRKVFM